MRRKIRFGLVGYGSPHGEYVSGRGGAMLKMAVEGFEDIVPAAVCDKNPESLKNAGGIYPDAGLFSSFDEMLEKAGLDALFVGTPATCHAEFAVKALGKNIHTLSEIPVAASAAEAKELWDAHLASTAIYMTAANPNYWAFVDTAVDLRRKGVLGDPCYIEAEYIHDVRSYFERTPWRETFEPIRYCTHSLGPMLRLIDEDLEWVSCFDTGGKINSRPDQHDIMAALFRTRSNVVLRLLISFINNYPSGGHHYRIFTTKGAFERKAAYGKDCPERTLFYSSESGGHGEWSTLPSDYMRPEHKDNPRASGHGGADYALLDDFFKAVREGTPSPVSLREGLRMTLPGIYAAESARRGGELTRIEYPWAENSEPSR